MLHYIWHIITIENLVFGIALIIMAFYKDSSKVKFAAWLIAAMLTVRWIVVLWFTLVYKNDLSQILVDSVAIFIVVGLLLLGTRIRNKSSDMGHKKVPCIIDLLPDQSEADQ